MRKKKNDKTFSEEDLGMDQEHDIVEEFEMKPLSEPHEKHPMGTGLGAVSGAAAGATIGSAGGPVGAVAGGIIGGFAGGMAGRAAAEALDPLAEAEYWRVNYATRPYVSPDASFDTYESAYRVGYEGALRYPGYTFEEVEEELRNLYDERDARIKLPWDKAKNAVRDAWDRVKVSLSDDRNVF